MVKWEGVQELGYCLCSGFPQSGAGKGEEPWSASASFIFGEPTGGASGTRNSESRHRGSYFLVPPPFTSSLWGKTSSLAHFDVKIKQTGAARMGEWLLFKWFWNAKQFQPLSLKIWLQAKPAQVVNTIYVQLFCIKGQQTRKKKQKRMCVPLLTVSMFEKSTEEQVKELKSLTWRSQQTSRQ